MSMNNLNRSFSQKIKKSYTPDPATSVSSYVQEQKLIKWLESNYEAAIVGKGEYEYVYQKLLQSRPKKIAEWFAGYKSGKGFREVFDGFVKEYNYRFV